MIKIYGSPRSSAGRCYLLLEELGLPYEVVNIDMMGKREHKSPEFLKLNPNGKVPCLIDGDYVIWESMAINQYLAEKYRPELCGASPEERGRIQQWTVWAIAELQPPMVDMIVQLMFVPEDKRDMGLVERARAKVPPMLEILDKHLAGKKYVIGNKLTVADFNLSAVVNIAHGLQMPLDAYPNVRAWFEGLKARPSYTKFAELRA